MYFDELRARAAILLGTDEASITKTVYELVSHKLVCIDRTQRPVVRLSA